MEETKRPHVWLDARGFDDEMWRKRFPNILESCLNHGIDPRIALIPVVPAQHYVSGGLVTDVNGRTSIDGLFAVGECACTGVHGANRLASNSLLEGLVFADRIGALLASGLPARRDPLPRTTDSALADASAREQIQQLMTANVGVLRTAESMAQASAQIAAAVADHSDEPHTGAWEATNVSMVAQVLTAAAALREETRGSHWREDFQSIDDENWRVRIVSTRRPDSSVEISLRKVTG